MTQHPVLNGVRTTQTIEYDLVRRDGNVLTLHSTVRQTAPRQRLELETIPAGAHATLVSSRGEGTIDLVLELTQVLPASSTGSVRVDQAIKATQGGRSIRLEQSLTSSLTLTPA